MSHPIKTYDDGSELTAEMVVVAFVASAIIGGAGAYAMHRFESWKTRRLIKKTDPTHPMFKK